MKDEKFADLCAELLALVLAEKDDPEKLGYATASCYCWVYQTVLALEDLARKQGGDEHLLDEARQVARRSYFKLVNRNRQGAIR